jgi:hypothetical protein
VIYEFSENFSELHRIMRMRIKDRAALETRKKELLDFARSYLSERFPNPDRQGCPADASLRSLAFNPKESEPTVTEHLAVCSPCFRRYSELLAELNFLREEQRGLSWGRVSAWTKSHRVFALTVAVCVLLIVIGAGLFWRRMRMPNTPSLETHQPPAPVERVNPTVAYSAFGLDLSALSPVRGAESGTGSKRRVPIPSSPLDLTLTLPLASPEGHYDLKLTVGSETVWSKSAQAHLLKGKTLIQVEADFKQIPTGNYNLEVQSSTGVRLVQAVSFQSVSPKSGEQKP